MPFDPNPWGVENATHSADLFRAIAYLAGNGEEGVLSPTDLKVVPFGTPGAGVNVQPGVAVIPRRLASVPYQSYIGRMPTQDTAGVTATGSGATRRDLVVAVVENPAVADVAGYTAPVPAADGPYVFVRVIANVGAAGVLPAPVTNRSTAIAYLAANNLAAIPLALIDLPISTATVTAGMITDLRVLASQKRDRQQFVIPPGAVNNLTSTVYVDWGISTTVNVPIWATKAIIVGKLGAVKLDRSTTTVNGTAVGNLRVRLGGTAGAPTAFTQATFYDSFQPFADPTGRFDFEAGDTIAVPQSLRGQFAVPFALQALRSSGNKNLYVDTASYARLEIEFQGAAI